MGKSGWIPQSLLSPTFYLPQEESYLSGKDDHFHPYGSVADC